MMSNDDRIPHDDFAAGFKLGWQIIKRGAMVPMTPMARMTPMGSTPFIEGVKAGLRKAGHEIK